MSKVQNLMKKTNCKCNCNDCRNTRKLDKKCNCSCPNCKRKS